MNLTSTRRWLYNWLDLRPGQLRPLVFCSAGSFFLFAFIVLSRSLAEATYLFSFSVNTLPYVTAGYVLLTIPVVGTFARWMNKYPPKTVMTWLLVLLCAGTLAIRLLLEVSRPAVVLFYLWMTLSQTLLSSGFWIVTSEQFDLRGAKRLYGLIAAGGTLGAMTMGTFLRFFDREDGGVLLLMVVATIFAFLLTLYFLPEPAASEPSVKGPSSQDHFSLRESLALVWKNPHLRTIAMIVLCASTASTLVDYQFKEFARTSVETKSDLTSFFGSFYGWLGAISLVTNLLMGPFLAKAGISITLSILPLVLIGGSASFLLFPSLGLATLVRGAEYSLRKSLHRSAIEIAYVPIPEELRRKAKPFVDSVLDASAEGLGALILFSWIIVAKFPSRFLSIFVLALGALLLCASWLMGKHYLQTLVERLTEKQQKPDRRDFWGNTFSDSDYQKLRDLRKFREKHKTTEGEVAPPPAAIEHDIPALIQLLAQDHKKAGPALLAKEDVAVPFLMKSLADEDLDLSIGRRIPQILAQSTNSEVNDALVTTLRSRRFEIRYRASVALMRRKQHILFVATKEQEAAIWEAIEAEAQLGRPVWEMEQLLEDTDIDQDGFVSQQVGVRGALILEHTFRLLALAVDTECVQCAFSGVTSEDSEQRGFALEYLEHVLPARIREALWPFIGDMSEKEKEKALRPIDQVVTDLRKSTKTLFSADKQKAEETLQQIVEEASTKDPPNVA